MPTPEQIQQAIQKVTDQQSFINVLLRQTLGWEIPDGISDVEEIAYAWSEDDLRTEGLDQKVVEGQIWQIQPLDAQMGQEWGIFILEFKSEHTFVTGRGLTGPLRKVLRGLVPNRRNRPANLPTWERPNLLFICTYEYKHFRFAYFKAPKTKEKTAPLALFGWNQGDRDVRTLCEHNLPHLQWDSEASDFGHWREAFSIEKVTKDFYREYARVFEIVEKIIGAENSISGNDLRLYTQMLFNRLMFLRFIEKKGWLKINDSTEYLATLYAAGGISGQSLYRSRLCPLFFEALAVEGRQQLAAVGEVVFLNGGLFEKTDFDNKVEDISDNAFESILGHHGLFYRFNFTVEESTPLDIEVAVDPEMLGKVFEELVTGRHESGSYYTPRPVVAFMCREAIKAYLNEKTSAPSAVIEKLVDENEIEEDTLTEGAAAEIVDCLESLKAVDPACGSGAYLLGLLQELIAIRRTLQNEKLISDPDFLYKLKRDMISNSLYGVDIDAFATNIASLRLWLSLTVESETPQPLPNLEFKIETGNSVLGPCETTLGPMFEAELNQLSGEIAKLKEEHQNAHENKKELQKQVQEKIDYLRGFIIKSKTEGLIVWPADFAEVFAQGGFSIVLANPPYIRQELIKKEKPALRENFPETFTSTADLYTYFYTRAIELLAPGGVLSFISSNKWFRAGYGKKLRGYIAQKCYIHSITDFGELPVFETAATFPMIFVAQKSDARGETTFTQVKNLKPPYPDVKAIIAQNGIKLPADAIKGDIWNLTDANTILMLRSIEKAGKSLEEYVGQKIYVGLKTGFNRAFIIDNNERERIIAEDPISEDLIKPVIKGDDVRKWYIRQKKQWIILTSIGVEIKKYPGIFNYLKKWEDNLKKRSDQGNYWWELRACSYYNLFENANIFFPDIAKESRFALSKKGTHAEMTAFFIPSDDLYLLGILNSSIAWKYFSLTASVLGDADKGGRLRLKRQYVRKLSIPNPSEQSKKTIERLVQKCLNAEGQDCEKWEKEIDEIVTKLYGLEE